jgi:molecular chaperone GrpE
MKKQTQTNQPVEENGEVSEWKMKYLRALADYQNLEKRTREDSMTIRMYASMNIIQALLPVLDNVERASNHLKDDGLMYTVRQFNKVLADVGVAKIEVIGKKFDPTEMECVTVSEGVEGIVLEELTTGYRLYDKVLRPAHVRVGNGAKKKEAPVESVEQVLTNDQK